MMDGFLSKINEAEFESILWVVIPMLNVDGVILGNNRTGISGLDYNRYWNL
jgi:murein tripeptide amidase MpaA